MKLRCCYVKLLYSLKKNTLTKKTFFANIMEKVKPWLTQNIFQSCIRSHERTLWYCTHKPISIKITVTSRLALTCLLQKNGFKSDRVQEKIYGTIAKLILQLDHDVQLYGNWWLPCIQTMRKKVFLDLKIN